MQNFPFLPFAGSPQPFSRHHADEGRREHVKPQPGRKDLCGDDCRNEDVGVRSPREPSSHLVRAVPRQEAVAEEAEEDECCNRPSGVSLRQTGKRQERRVWRHRIIPEAGVDADADGNLDEYWNKACRAIPQGMLCFSCRASSSASMAFSSSLCFRMMAMRSLCKVKSFTTESVA